MKDAKTMKSSRFNSQIARPLCATALVLLLLLPLGIFGQANATAAATAKTFATPEAAAKALINAAEKYDVATLEAIFGPAGKQIINTGEPAYDKEMAQKFAEQARTKM